MNLRLYWKFKVLKTYRNYENAKNRFEGVGGHYLEGYSNDFPQVIYICQLSFIPFA